MISQIEILDILHLETEKQFVFTYGILKFGLVKYQFVSLLCS